MFCVIARMVLISANVTCIHIKNNDKNATIREYDPRVKNGELTKQLERA